MTKEEKIQKYKEWIFKVSAYRMALAVLNLDKLTVAPTAGAAFRDERAAYLAGEAFSITNDPEMFEIVKEFKDDESLDEEIRRSAYLYYRNMESTMCIPKDEYIEMSKLMNQSYDAWLEAKTKNDYSIFEPYLKKVIEAKKKVYAYRNKDIDLYDQMLDDYEPGMNQEKYDAFFEQIKERLLPFIQKVTKAKQLDDSFNRLQYPKNKQKEYTEHLLHYLQFDSSWGYQNESEHPFTSWTCENDCRTTTKYVEDILSSAILSTIHEVGHATYEHNIRPAYDGMILSEGVSSGMHESQSRLMENYLGRTLAFWEANFPKLKETFPEQLEKVSAEDFYKAINISRIGCIRTEADELTYPLHIVVRYEIEKGLFNGTISTEGLNETWKQKYKEYLGIDIPDDRNGILQDVHWSDGSFGYFPTYALGSAFAAQFMQKMREDIEVDEALRNRRMDICIEWLKENIHQYGCLYDADEIMRIATGKDFDVNIYLDYLEDKYTKLYQL